MAGICLFGGAFDPPHKSHRRIAEQVLATMEIDELIVMPCGDHPLKPTCEANRLVRLQMCNLNFADIDRVTISTLEIDRIDKSYSVDTLAELRAEYGHDDPIYFLIGSDNVTGLPDWHEYEQLFEFAEFLVFPRLGHPCDAASLAATRLSSAQQGHLLAGVLDWEADAVRSSEIRRQLHAGESSGWLLPEVAAWIDAEGLYRDELA